MGACLGDARCRGKCCYGHGAAWGGGAHRIRAAMTMAEAVAVGRGRRCLAAIASVGRSKTKRRLWGFYRTAQQPRACTGSLGACGMAIVHARSCGAAVAGGGRRRRQVGPGWQQERRVRGLREELGCGLLGCCCAR